MKQPEPLTKKDFLLELQKVKRFFVKRISESYVFISQEFKDTIKPVKKLLHIIETLHQRMSFLEKELTEQVTKNGVLEKRIEKLERQQNTN